jgi:hypothetical protein
VQNKLKFFIGGLFIFSVPFLLSLAIAKDTSLQIMSDAEVKRAIINDSISAYPGNCPCDYNYDRAGRKCGKRSAWSKPGGYQPICYDYEISDEMLREWRRVHGSVKKSQ